MMTRMAKSKTSQGAPLLLQNRGGGSRARGGGDDYKDGSDKKKWMAGGDYYKFYLDNA